MLRLEAVDVAGPGTLGISAAGRTVIGVVVYFHGADQKAVVTQTNMKHVAFFEPILRAGYAVVSADAGGNAFGNLISRDAYRHLVRSAERRYGTSATFFVAESMGALAALALLADPEWRAVKGMVGISPLMGIPPAGRSIDFIAYAWGGAVPADGDPLTWAPQSFAERKFTLFYSPTDSVVPPAASADAFQRAFGTVADIRITSCVGGHVASDCYRGDDVARWMGSLA